MTDYLQRILRARVYDVARETPFGSRTQSEPPAEQHGLAKA